MNHLLLSLLFLFGFCNLTYCQSKSANIENTKISILTCRSGDQLYTTFGHTAIRISNPVTRMDYVYNYGLFSFDTPNFYPKFLRGQLPYFLGGTQMKNFLREYKYDKRTVFEQELILNDDQKLKMIEFLKNNAKPENRIYNYDFFYDNCATRVVDLYGLAGEISYTNEIEEKTFRDLLKENLQNLVWPGFGIDLLIGARAERVTNRRDQMFLPEYVMTNLASAKVDGVSPLAKPAEIVLDFESLNANRKSKGTNWPLICSSILFLVTLLFNFSFTSMTRLYNKLFLVISGVFGLFLLFMWFGTNHGATRDNWNVLWFNPLFFIVLLSKGVVKKTVVYIAFVALILSALNCFFTFLPQFFNIAFLPIILSLLVIIYKEIEKIRKPASIA